VASTLASCPAATLAGIGIAQLTRRLVIDAAVF
jgi:hypothetical protein